MSGAKFLTISSRDRTSGSFSECQFAVQLPTGVIGATSVELLNCTLPNTAYNIALYNNTIYFTEGGAVLMAYISEGNYDSSTIIDAIETALNSAGGSGTYTASYDITTYQMNFTSTVDFSLLWGDYPSTVSSNNSAAYPLGWDDANTASAMSQTAERALMIGSPLNYYISVDAFGSYMKSTNTADNATFIINSTSMTNGEFEMWSNNSRYPLIMYFPGGINFQILNVRLSIAGNQLYSLNGADWSFTIGIGYTSQ